MGHGEVEVVCPKVVMLLILVCVVRFCHQDLHKHQEAPCWSVSWPIHQQRLCMQVKCLPENCGQFESISCCFFLYFILYDHKIALTYLSTVKQHCLHTFWLQNSFLAVFQAVIQSVKVRDTSACSGLLDYGMSSDAGIIHGTRSCQNLSHQQNNTCQNTFWKTSEGS